MNTFSDNSGQNQQLQATSQPATSSAPTQEAMVNILYVNVITETDFSVDRSSWFALSKTAATSTTPNPTSRSTASNSTVPTTATSTYGLHSTTRLNGKLIYSFASFSF